MAVYKQSYRGYPGPRTPDRRRALIVYRQARRTIFQSRLLLSVFVACLVFPLLELVAIYVAHHPAFLAYLRIRHFFAIGPAFFFTYARFQCSLAFLFTAFAAPGLIAPDLANGGLVLYFSRPLARWEYLAGKIAVLWVLLSELTWIPGLVLFAVQCDLGGATWRAGNLYLGWSLVAACWIWIVVLSLVALALSAWVRWRVVAGAALLGMYFFGAGLAQAINFVLQTSYGSLCDFMGLHLIVWSGLFRLAPPPLALETGAWLVLAGLASAALALILRRVRPLEVVQ